MDETADPIKNVDLGRWEELAALVPDLAPLRDQVTDAYATWRALREFVDKYMPEEVVLPAWSFRWDPPASIVAEAHDVWRWCTICDSVRAATGISIMNIGALLPALDWAMRNRQLLVCCNLTRALLEHAAYLGYVVGLFGEHTGLATARTSYRIEWTLNGALFDRQPPRALYEALRKVFFGTRFDWASAGFRMQHDDLKRLRMPIQEGDKQVNVLTVIQKFEDAIRLAGVVQHYELLCDCVHPSRGSRELLSYGELAHQGSVFGRSYRLALPSELAFEERLAKTVCPALLPCLLAVLLFGGGFLKATQAMQRETERRMAGFGFDYFETMLSGVESV